MRSPFPAIATVLLLTAMASGCSIDRLILRAAADSLSGSGEVFAGDEDPELVGAALPFALKTYEVLASENPDHAAIQLTTGTLFVKYANAFVQTPASMSFDYSHQEAQYRRAKLLYLRGWSYIGAAAEIRRPGFRQALPGEGRAALLASLRKSDVDLLYWAGASILGAYALEPLDFELALQVPAARDMLERAIELYPAFERGAAHDILISFYAAAPAALGGSREKALYHFERAVELSGGLRVAPYLSLASGLAVREQDRALFRGMLTAALAVQIEADPGNRLANIIARRRAAWLLENEDYFFIIEDQP